MGAEMLVEALLALLIPTFLLLGLTALVATGRLRWTPSAEWLLARQNRLWMGGVIALAAAGAAVALSRN